MSDPRPVRWLASLVLGAMLPAVQAGTIVEGHAFVDLDGDGRPGPEEPAAEGIKVSNGREVAVSGPGGRFALELREGDTVFAIKPPGYAVRAGENGLPEFWRHHFPGGSPDLRHGGIPEARVERFDVARTPEGRFRPRVPRTRAA